LKAKTVVFVTNRLEFVSQCDRVVMLSDGEVVVRWLNPPPVWFGAVLFC
jgi:ABC-type transport system involved in cytochrome bd biosynthesis fused ATPase/permease subunit